MADRELLELAAKAAGLPMHRYCEAWKAMARYTLQDGYHGPFWNPLTDDGDALRLAVKLRMLIEPARTMSGTFVEVHAYSSGRGDCSGVERLGQDDCAATRRAIVRAAAAIGEAMP